MTNQPRNGDWQHELFSCCESMGDCLFACICPSCFNFVATQAAGESTGCAILTCLCPIAMCCVRTNVREARGIDVKNFFFSLVCI